MTRRSTRPHSKQLSLSLDPFLMSSPTVRHTTRSTRLQSLPWDKLLSTILYQPDILSRRARMICVKTGHTGKWIFQESAKWNEDRLIASRLIDHRPHGKSRTIDVVLMLPSMNFNSPSLSPSKMMCFHQVHGGDSSVIRSAAMLELGDQ
jgi:hypothetical protein